MATYSPVLGLKLNDQSDPFELSDFIQNWQLLDSSPGIFICTSTTRPSWGSAQNGRLIFMKDLKQTSYWNGSSWNDLLHSVPSFAWGAVLNTWMNPGSSPQFNIMTFTTPRPCSIAVFASGTYQYPNNYTQDAYQSIVFDGVKQELGGFREQTRFTGNTGDTGGYAGGNVLSMTMMPAVAAGQHRIGIQVDVSSAYKASVFFCGAKIMALISNYSSGNSL